MSFLQPLMLYALPIIALPVIIHLINQRRFRTIRWGAMMFLLAANRMSRGYARLRQWLILAARTLAILGLIVAISRPLASGWLGLAAGGRVDTTLVLVDRSPSMQQQEAGGGNSKLQAGISQLVRSLGLVQSNHLVMIDSAHPSPQMLETPSDLKTALSSAGVSASADLPGMLQVAHDWLRENRPSRSEIWIVSDVRKHDWHDESGRWDAIRESLHEFPLPVRIHLLAYTDPAPLNRSVRVTDVRRVATASGAELLVSLKVEQTAAVDGSVSLPIQLEIAGTRTAINAEMTGNELELKDHTIPIDPQLTRGWGRVMIPADANPADNEFYFVFDRPAARRSVTVAENRGSVRALELAAAISPNPDVESVVEVITQEEVADANWDDVSLVLWQAPLPGSENASLVRDFVNRGGNLIFFPPDVPTADEFAGIRWDSWIDLPQEASVATWTSDQDLLANAQSGAALPVGELKIERYCALSGEYTPLATLADGGTLLARQFTDRGQVYFCATTTAAGDSTLAREGIVLYVLVQRALAAGAEQLGMARQLTAGAVPASEANDWTRISDGGGLSSEYTLQSGVYQQGDRLYALNRSSSEDLAAIVGRERVDQLFRELDFDRVDQSAGTRRSLLEEIWRLFLALMLLALVLEACLCVPRRAAAVATRVHDQGVAA